MHFKSSEKKVLIPLRKSLQRTGRALLSVGISIFFIFSFVAVGHARDNQKLKVLLPYVKAEGDKSLSEKYNVWSFVETIDGDTFRIENQAFMSAFSRLSVRLLGVDTPEKRGPKCPKEKKMGLAATALAKKFFQEAKKDGKPIILENIQYDKYGKRIDAEVFATIGGKKVSLGERLLAASLARPYNGGRKRRKVWWCSR